MKLRIALWAGAGFLVACGWALYVFATGPHTAIATERTLWTLICVTCPVALAGTAFPISLPLVLVANAATYALVGLMVESLRRRLHPAH